MLKVKYFICWALTHAASVPADAQLPIPVEKCCLEPWHYLFGSVKVQTTPETVARYRDKYIARGWKPKTYDYYTKGWKTTDYATDCQGLLDAYLTYECKERTDINADMNYRYWCTEKRTAAKDYGSYSYALGDALFMANSKGKMTHVGWVCGFTHTGEPLVIEARGLAYGVVITRLTERPWTHTGRMTVKFNYEESEEQTMVKAKYEVASPMHTGAAYKAMQVALNAAGYTDGDGDALAEDGKWGAKSQTAYNSMIADYSTPAPDETNQITTDDAATVLMHGIRITITKDGDSR